MRFVDRNTVGRPVFLGPAGGAQDELRQARAHYAGANPKTYEFKAYREDSIKAALESLFHGKCAYCESSYKAVGPVDVEHYRPKGKVEEEPTHVGYWWLAADWENLLPACLDCNRRRRHRVATPNMTQADLIAARRASVGKKDAFPIRGHRAFGEADDITAEDPLLIDPTRSDPAQHLAWPVDNSLSVVVAVDRGGLPDQYGDASIKCYALNRHGLVEARTAVLGRLKLDRDHMTRLLDIALELSNPERQKLIDEAMTVRAQLESQCAPDQPYSALAKVFYVETMAMLKARYLALLEKKAA